MSNALTKGFMHTAVCDLFRALEGGCLTGAVTLSMCLLDYLAYLDSPNKKNVSADFKRIVSKYLTPENASYRPDQMFALRCSLVHTYGESEALCKAGLDGFIIAWLNGPFHLTMILHPPNHLEINVDSIVADVVWAAWRFWSTRGMDPIVVGKSASTVKVGLVTQQHYDALAYCDLHPALRTLDSASPQREALNSAITEILRNVLGH